MPLRRELTMRLDGMRLTLPPDAPSAVTYRLGWYEPELRRWFQAHLRPAMTFVDGGVFAGYCKVQAAALVGPDGRVWAFEPDPVTRPYLERNARQYDLHQVEVVPFAIGERVGELSLVDGGRERGRLGQDAGAARRVRVTWLDAWFQDRGWPAVQVVKPDLETGELLALHGMRELIRRNLGIRVVLEVLPGQDPSASREKVMELAATCREIGLGTGAVVELGAVPVPVERVPPPSSGSLFNVVSSE
ncbi:FkbM family methyltransferase [Myxococcota bacterium]|nr:FkbM family methyltransferase [Myxococcota bacterium]